MPSLGRACMTSSGILNPTSLVLWPNKFARAIVSALRIGAAVFWGQPVAEVVMSSAKRSDWDWLLHPR